jgi:hypothetical protein
MRTPLLLALLLPCLACNPDDGDSEDNRPPRDDTGNEPDTDADADTDTDTDTDADADTDADTDIPGTLPEAPGQHGVIYAVHYGTRDLYGYRVDGQAPRRFLQESLSSECHDMAVDRERDLLVVVQDVGRKVDLYQLDVPADASDAIDAPSLLGSIGFGADLMPLFARVDPYHQRLYVAAGSTSGTLTHLELRIYDTTDPSDPQRLHSAEIPVTASWDIDPVRRVAFIVDNSNHELSLWDLSGDEATMLGGDPVALRELYPQENTWGFQARNLTVDPWHSRVYAARSQGALSELIAFDYPADIPSSSGSYASLATHGDLVMVEDWFDVDVDLKDRTYLLDGFTPVPDPASGSLFFLANAWNGTMSTALVVPMDQDLQAREGCGDHDGIGCWVMSHHGGSAGSYRLTDGAACADWTHGVMAATSYDPYSATTPGILHLYSFDGAGLMEPLLDADGDDLSTGGMPIALVCH